MDSIVFILGLIGIIPYLSAIVSFVHIRKLRQRLQLHEAIIRSLSSRLADLQTSPQTPRPTPDVEYADGSHTRTDTSSQWAEAVPVSDGFVDAGIIPPPVGTRPSTPDRLEMVIGGTWLTRIGAVATVLGALFFLKFAFDNGWITESMRVLIGAVVGLGLVIGSDRWRAKGLRVFAQGLAGSGIPVLYLAVYASYGFYDLVSQPAAFVLMSMVTCLAVFISLRHDSVFIASMAAAGGMLTPVWLSTGDVNTVGLFGYLALLFIGLSWIGHRRLSWWGVPLIGFVGVWAYWNQWMGLRSSMTDPDVTEGTLFAFAFLVSGLLYHYAVERQAKDQLVTVRRVFVGLHSVVMYTMVIRALMSDSPWINGATAALLGMLFAANAIIYHQDENVKATSMFAVFALAALDHACLAIENPYLLSIGLSVLSVTSLALLRHRERPPEMIAIVLIVVQSLAVASHEASMYSFPAHTAIPLLNIRTAALVLSGLALILTVRQGSSTLRLNALARAVISAGGVCMVIWAAHLDVYGLFANTDSVAEPMIDTVRSWPSAFGHAIASMCSVTIGVLLIRFPIRHLADSAILSGMAVSTAASLWWLTHASAISDPSLLAPFVSVRTLTGLLITGALLICLRGLQSSTSVWSATLQRSVIGILAVGFSFVFITMEVVWPEVITMYLIRSGFTSGSTGDSWNRFHLWMSGTWIMYSILLMIAGFVRPTRSMRIASLILLSITILKVFLYDLSFLQQPYRIVSFIALGVILMLAGFLYQRFRGVILEEMA